MKRLVLFLLLSFALGLHAKSLSYAQIHRMPRCVEKDYYIWRYLQQASTSKTQAKKMIHEAWRINPLLKKAYRKKTGLNPPSIKKSPKRLSPSQRLALEKKKALTRRLLSSSKPLAAWKKLDPEMRLFVFNYAGKAGRKKLDYAISEKEWQKLTRYRGINRTLRYIRIDHLPHLSRVLRYPPARHNRLRYDYLMRLGFEALTRGEKKIAEYDFALAAPKASKRELADRALFWAWKSDGNKTYLHRLVKSYDINLYTLAARDALKLNYDLGITPHLPKGRVGGFDLRDPLQWSWLKKKIFNPHTDMAKLAQRFKTSQTVGHYSYIKSKAGKDVPQYFPMPYRNFMKKLPLKRQAILYAIARQESRFIPASVSSSFALGMMQIMPFLVDHLARQRGEKIDYDALFDPITALEYANTHMDYLTKWLHHPLFVAYAYNAGIGFTKRLIRRKDLFENKQKYDPWISLERVANYQANDYGKKVLSNYVIYMNKLGYPIRLSELMRVVHLPKLTDEFRNSK